MGYARTKGIQESRNRELKAFARSRALIMKKATSNNNWVRQPQVAIKAARFKFKFSFSAVRSPAGVSYNSGCGNVKLGSLVKFQFLSMSLEVRVKYRARKIGDSRFISRYSTLHTTSSRRWFGDMLNLEWCVVDSSPGAQSINGVGIKMRSTISNHDAINRPR